MTLQTLAWYRIKETNQYCQVAGIMSKNDPEVHVKSAPETLSGFVVALIWFTPSSETPGSWTKRAIMLELKKALGLLRRPRDDDLPVIRRLEKVAGSIPFQSVGVDGVKTEPTGEG